METERRIKRLRKKKKGRGKNRETARARVGLYGGSTEGCVESGWVALNKRIILAAPVASSSTALLYRIVAYRSVAYRIVSYRLASGIVESPRLISLVSSGSVLSLLCRLFLVGANLRLNRHR